MRLRNLLLLVPFVLFAAACSPPDVVIYSALDQVHSEPIIRQFERNEGITVRALYDQEAVKTVGLVNRLVEEESNPKCDVFWNNELVHTIRLKNKGLLAPYKSPSAADIPAKWKDAEGYWTGFAARARVFILNEEKMKAAEPDETQWPNRTEDLLDEKWKGEVGMAKPLAGTTLTHMSVLWATKGPEYVQNFWTTLFKNEGHVTTGNAHLMKEVAQGSFLFGYTDTDDFNKALVEKKPVRRIFPDQTEGGDVLGCLVIPNSVSLVKNGPNPELGKKLIDYILSKQVEAELAKGPSAQMPVRKDVERPEHVRSAEELVTMDVDWAKVAEAVEPANAWLTEFLAK